MNTGNPFIKPTVWIIKSWIRKNYRWGRGNTAILQLRVYSWIQSSEFAGNGPFSSLVYWEIISIRKHPVPLFSAAIPPSGCVKCCCYIQNTQEQAETTTLTSSYPFNQHGKLPSDRKITYLNELKIIIFDYAWAKIPHGGYDTIKRATEIMAQGDLSWVL